jgi:hypothetical protein
MLDLSTMSTRHAVCSSRAVRHQQACIQAPAGLHPGTSRPASICSAGRIIFHFPFQPFHHQLSVTGRPHLRIQAVHSIPELMPASIPSLACAINMCVGISHHVASVAAACNRVSPRLEFSVLELRQSGPCEKIALQHQCFVARSAAGVSSQAAASK